MVPGEYEEEAVPVVNMINYSELEVLRIFKTYWDIEILGTVQACTVLNIARLRMLKTRYWRY